MTTIKIKSLIMGIAHSVIIPFILVLLSQNLFIGLAYYLIPLTAYETFASHKIEGKNIFYIFTLIIWVVVLISLGGL